MLRLLIVDDERAIRESIRASIDWEALGISVIGLCKNGAEAYDTILDEYPDIVLTDIKMPGLNGLELIARTAEARLDTQFVILSGHAEFEFAKEAMRWGIRHYLLKPTNAQQLLQIMTEVREECYQKRRRSDLEQHHRQFITDRRQMLIQSMIAEALGTETPLEELIGRNSQYLDVENVNYELCYFYYVEPQSVDAYLKQIGALHQKRAEGVLQHVLYVNMTLIVFFESYTSLYTGLDSAFASLSAPDQSTRIEYQRVSCASLAELMRILMPRLLRFDTVTLMHGARSVHLNNFSRLIHACGTLVAELAQTAAPKRGAVLGRIAELLGSTGDIQFLRLIASGILVKYASLSGDPHALSGIARIDFEQEDNPDALREALLKKLSELSSARSQAEAEGEADFVAQIRRYVQSNISNSELSLKWLAENRLYMNVDYLSKQFALKTGEKFSAFLSRVRIERAKELLLAGAAGHIYEIAAEVGCGNNPQYFSQIFKRSVGMTPTEFIQREKTS